MSLKKLNRDLVLAILELFLVDLENFIFVTILTSFKAISVEVASVKPEDVDFLEKIPSILKNYSPRDIYNFDETNFFLFALPNNTLNFKKEKYIRRELSNERVLGFYVMLV